jgi:FKBP-type peptidyl-prolyl cis-trans isomerase 2
MDMTIGEKRTIEIDPENAYGHINEYLITEVNKSQVPDMVQIGEVLQGNSQNGPINVRVVDVKGDVVTIDANHPLAGKKLIFELEVLDIA